MTNIKVSDEAYKYNEGPILLLAGPGTGKTYQLAQRIKYLTNKKQVNADEITVITFTKEAANGMRIKLKTQGNEYIDEENRPKNILTMHGLGYKILKENLAKIGLKTEFNIVEENFIRKALIRDAAILLGYSEQQAEIAFDDRVKANKNIKRESKEIIKKYEEILRFCNSVDYDDLITLANKLLIENEDIRKYYSKSSKYLLIDEYQDINQGQFELIQLLSKDNLSGLFAVGDDDQSIYGFRGGSPTFIRNFIKHFGENSIIFQMATSRRCPINIMECATSVVSKFDSSRLHKVAYKYKRTDPGKVIIHDCPSEDREAEIIGSILKTEIEHLKSCEQCGELPRRDCFILVPNINFAKKLQSTLKNFGIIFDSQFEKKSEGFESFILVKKWVLNPSSNFLTRQIIELLSESGILEVPSSRTKLKEKIILRNQALKTIAGLWSDVIKYREPLIKILYKESAKSDLIKKIASILNGFSQSYEKEDLPDFIDKVIRSAKPWSSLSKFIDDISSEKKTLNYYNNNVLNVRILTIQRSKGLQAHSVFIIGLEEDIIPRKSEPLDEQARLFFVGMTRAKEQLHIFKSRKRMGSVSYRPIPYDVKPSRFLENFPREKHEKQYHQPKSKLKKNV